ncbi:hypothetical protein DPX16_18749 [Anabarilius grahami]|uniref:Uncharacterized protein n=1 Tax=Anabarilius grahami TaxID=495550 RepID=A0A3N0Y1Q2_ANAGA|nr:hypothetical protein DPX16_18749 [Anabarilius grahami]
MYEDNTFHHPVLSLKFLNTQAHPEPELVPEPSMDLITSSPKSTPESEIPKSVPENEIPVSAPEREIPESIPESEIPEPVPIWSFPCMFLLLCVSGPHTHPSSLPARSPLMPQNSARKAQSRPKAQPGAQLDVCSAVGSSGN